VITIEPPYPLKPVKPSTFQPSTIKRLNEIQDYLRWVIQAWPEETPEEDPFLILERKLHRAYLMTQEDLSIPPTVVLSNN